MWMSSCSSTVNTNRNRIRIEHNLLEQLSNYVEKFHENATFRPAGEYRQDCHAIFPDDTMKWPFQRNAQRQHVLIVDSAALKLVASDLPRRFTHVGGIGGGHC